MTKKNKRYFWLKLKDDFFNQKEIKMLRKIAGGDTYTVIYLKMLLLSLKNDGKIYFDDIASDFVEEIALDIDEETENVQVTFNYLKQKGLIEFENNDEIEMINIASMIGSETDKAAIMRRKRARDKQLKSNIVTPELPERYPEIEIESDIELDTEIETGKTKKESLSYNSKVFDLLNERGVDLSKQGPSLMISKKMNGIDDLRFLEKAIDIAESKGVMNAPYILSIINNWFSDGKTSYSKLLEFEKKSVQKFKTGITHELPPEQEEQYNNLGF